MYKKFLIACVSVSISCHGTQEIPVIQENISAAQQDTLQKAPSEPTHWGAWWAWMLSYAGAIITSYTAHCEGIDARNNMRNGFDLNKQWLTLVKEHPELDITPPVKNVVDKITEQSKAWDGLQQRDLAKYTYKVLHDAQKMPGDLLIEKAVHKNLAWQGYYNTAAIIFLVCSGVAAAYYIAKNLPKKQSGAEMTEQELETAEATDDAQINVEQVQEIAME